MVILYCESSHMDAGHYRKMVANKMVCRYSVLFLLNRSSLIVIYSIFTCMTLTLHTLKMLNEIFHPHWFCPFERSN